MFMSPVSWSLCLALGAALSTSTPTCDAATLLAERSTATLDTDTASRETSVIETTGGPITGVHLTSSAWVDQAFYGVPYAAPPTGRRGRWQPPRELEPWASVLPCNATRPSCFGRDVPGVNTSFMSEDCLYLDIYTPSKAAMDASAASSSAASAPASASASRTPSQPPPPPSSPPPPLLPVMVYLHGGSLVEGSSTAIQSGFGGVANTTRAGVISISINYRVSVLGFLALDALAEADARSSGGAAGRRVAGNYGLLDCIAALRWVQANARAFGGDPARVTVYGQSSGGSLVLALAVSPLAGGLFASGISMSGSPRLSATLKEASTVWHPEVVNATRCGPFPGGKVGGAMEEEEHVEAHMEARSSGAPMGAEKGAEKGVGRDGLLDCLHNLTGAELQAALPKDWHSAAFDM